MEGESYFDIDRKATIGKKSLIIFDDIEQVVVSTEIGFDEYRNDTFTKTARSEIDDEQPSNEKIA